MFIYTSISYFPTHISIEAKAATTEIVKYSYIMIREQPLAAVKTFQGFVAGQGTGAPHSKKEQFTLP